MTADNRNNSEKEEAIRQLKKDFGEEGFKTLMEGADAIVDVTDKLGMTYPQFRDMVEDYARRGMIREKDGVIRGYDPKPEAEDNKEANKEATKSQDN